MIDLPIYKIQFNYINTILVNTFYCYYVQIQNPQLFPSIFYTFQLHLKVSVHTVIENIKSDGIYKT